MDARVLEPLNEYDADQMEMARSIEGKNKKNKKDVEMKPGAVVHIGRNSYSVAYVGKNYIVIEPTEENPYLAAYNRNVNGRT